MGIGNKLGEEGRKERRRKKTRKREECNVSQSKVKKGSRMRMGEKAREEGRKEGNKER